MSKLKALWARFLKFMGPAQPPTNPQVQEVSVVSEKESEEMFLVIPNYGRKLPMKSPAVLKAFVDGNRGMVNEYILTCLTNAIEFDLPEIVLFKLGESKLIAKITRDDFVGALEILDGQFLKSEEYEKVQQCRELIARVHVNRVIDESKKM